MIQVIEHGSKNKPVKCRNCGCVFTYEPEDCSVDSYRCLHVKCPDCNEKIFAGMKLRGRE